MAIVTKKQSKPQNQNKQQLLESLRDLGSGTTSSLNKDLIGGIGKDFFKEMLGLREQKFSGNLTPGETLEFNEVFSGKAEENKRVKLQLTQERQLRMEEQRLSNRKQQELRLQIQALTSEVSQLAQTTQGLSEEVKVAAFQAPVDAGVYHVVFFEKLISFIKDFRKKIENASTWLSAYNTKSKRRANSWLGQVKISGAKRMLSSEDYSQRAAA